MECTSKELKCDATLIFEEKIFFCEICQNFSLAHPGKLLKNQLVRQKINLFSDEWTSVKVFTAQLYPLNYFSVQPYLALCNDSKIHRKFPDGYVWHPPSPQGLIH